MKTKWYLFFLTIITVSIIIYNLFQSERNPSYEIGILMIGESRYEKFLGLREGLIELGYDDDEMTYVVKSANNDPAYLQIQVEELIRDNVDIIVTLGGIETLELKNKLEQVGVNIPVVFAGVAAPKEVGIIEDYRSPGANFTGINNYHTDLSGKRLELFRDLVPATKRVFALYDETIEISRLSLEKTMEVQSILQIEVIPCDISKDHYQEFIKNNVKEQDALLILPSYQAESLTEDIVQLSQRYQLPVMGIYEDEVKSGYLASYGTSFYDQGHQAARFVSSIIQGNSPGQLPIEMPDTLRFIVNKQAAEQLHMRINDNIPSIAEFISGGESH